MTTFYITGKKYFFPYLTEEGIVTLLHMPYEKIGKYDKNRFRKDILGNIIHFSNEEYAIKWLFDNIKEDKIDKKYIKYKDVVYGKMY